MDNELKQSFTRRLSQCNRGEMIVIIYDIYFAYESEMIEAYNRSEYENFKTAIRHGQDVLSELMESLDFSYEISGQLYELYRYCRHQLASAIFQNQLTGVENAHKIMNRLYVGFSKAAEQDQSPALMKNTQQVYAGMTYGRNVLNENCMDYGCRGFFA